MRRVITREELWNGNREPFSNLWSFNPEKSIIAWAATRHGVYRRALRGSRARPALGTRCGSCGCARRAEADAFLADVASAATMKED